MTLLKLLISISEENNMALFEPALAFMLPWEGRPGHWYTNNPNDPGKETYKGVSRPNNIDWTGWKLIDKHKVLVDFPECLEFDSELQDEVKWLYRQKYWEKAWGDKIASQNVANHFFDSVINPGFISIRLMQRALNEARSNDRSAYLRPFALSVDGIMGHNTLDALNGMHEAEFMDIFKLYRIEYYKEHSKPEFLHGLIRRAEA
jgi:lysozyme family protein